MTLFDGFEYILMTLFDGFGGLVPFGTPEDSKVKTEIKKIIG